VKIEIYYLAAGAEEFAAAAAEAAALFGLSSGGVLAAGDIAAVLPADAVLISNELPAAAKTTVITTVHYWREPGVLGSRSERETTAEAGPAAVRRLVQLNLRKLLGRLTGRDPGPWGILRGVRPAKIIHRLLDEGLPPAAVIDRFMTDYAVTADKARLITAIALRQRPFLAPCGVSRRQVGVYIGVPYCPSRCLYCSFPGYVLPADRAKAAAFFAALTADIAAAGALMARHGLAAQTVYLGGGTPTCLDEEDFRRLLGLIRRAFIREAGCEFTVEAGRPDTVTDGKIAAMLAAGVGRVSVNPQTMQEKTLKLIGRNHSVRDIIDVFKKIRAAGLPVINMDIIAGLPGEDEADMADTVARVAALAPDNLTVHTLAIKRGSLLAADPGAAVLPDEATTAGMLAIAADGAHRMGLAPYYLYRQKYMTGNLENIGYARPGTECIYNIQIIGERQTIIGVGPAAGTKAVAADFRLASCYNPKDLDAYTKNIDRYTRRRDDLIAGLFAKEEKE